jgi:hypothetical protein
MLVLVGHKTAQLVAQELLQFQYVFQLQVQGFLLVLRQQPLQSKQFLQQQVLELVRWLIVQEVLRPLVRGQSRLQLIQQPAQQLIMQEFKLLRHLLVRQVTQQLVPQQETQQQPLQLRWLVTQWGQRAIQQPHQIVKLALELFERQLHHRTPEGAS